MLMSLGYAVAGKEGASEASWSFLWVIFLGLLAAAVAGYAVYKYRIRVQLLFLDDLFVLVFATPHSYFY